MNVRVGMVCVFVLAAAVPVRADVAEESLARYAEPVDKSVNRALAYLAKVQRDDGSYPAQLDRNVGVASLATMAYLSKGYTPEVGPYAKQIDRGVDFVLDGAQKNGLIAGPGRSHGPMYSHCIATLMLSEVSGMVGPGRQKRIDKVLAGALRLILDAQKVPKVAPFVGGWRYQPHSRDADISLTGWALMALRSGRGNGAQVPKEAIDLALKFVLRCRVKDGGFAYQPGRDDSGVPRTGTALLALELAGRHRDKICLDAGKYILERLPKRFGGGNFYYGVYYCSQGMFQLGDAYWTRFAAAMYPIMLKFQKEDGSWPAGSGSAAQAGPVYSTSMSVLAMTVSYRQLPIYQR